MKLALLFLLLPLPALAEDRVDLDAIVATISAAPPWSQIAPLPVQALRLASDAGFSDATSGTSVITISLFNTLVPPDQRPGGMDTDLDVLGLGLALPADRLLDGYAEHVPLGRGCRGIKAAAHAFFAKPAKDLTAAEAALLAVLPGSADRFLADPDKLHARAAFLGQMMQDEGLIETAPETFPDIPPETSCPPT